MPPPGGRLHLKINGMACLDALVITNFHRVKGAVDTVVEDGTGGEVQSSHSGQGMNVGVRQRFLRVLACDQFSSPTSHPFFDGSRRYIMQLGRVRTIKCFAPGLSPEAGMKRRALRATINAAA